MWLALALFVEKFISRIDIGLRVRYFLFVNAQVISYRLIVLLDSHARLSLHDKRGCTLKECLAGRMLAISGSLHIFRKHCCSIRFEGWTKFVEWHCLHNFLQSGTVIA